MFRLALYEVLISLTLLTPVLAASPAERGKVYASTHCARCHAIGQRQHLPFRSAHAERGEHVDNPHTTNVPQRIQWN